MARGECNVYLIAAFIGLSPSNTSNMQRLLPCSVAMVNRTWATFSRLMIALSRSLGRSVEISLEAFSFVSEPGRTIV